jgi:hypothetical protein
MQVPEAEYRPELSSIELISELRELLATERHAERLISRYLADLADRIRARSDMLLDAYVDEFHAARCFFQLGVRDTRERVRIGRALRQLPRIERAFIDGALSSSRIRELTRVATPETEQHWLQLATRLDMRALEREVARAREPHADAEAPAKRQTEDSEKPTRTEWTTPNTVRVTWELSAEAWALFERALSGARRHSESHLTGGEAIEAIARDALAHQNEAADASDPRTSVVVYTCKHCRESELDTGSGALGLEATSAETLACGATHIDLDQAGQGRSHRGPLPAPVRRAVMLRDRCTCRVPGCNRRRYVDVHHLIPQASGGAHSRANCIVLCTTHHRLLHDGKLQIIGDAEGQLEVRDESGAPIEERKPWTDFALGSHADSTESRDSEQSVGSAVETSVETTQGGSAAGRRLLQVMAHRGGWTVDALIDASGLSASTVLSTLLFLELDGSVTHRDSLFEPR